MEKKSFLTGLVAGAGVAVIAAVSVPGFVPAPGREEAPRAPRSTVVVVQETAPAAPAPAPAPGPPPASTAGKGIDSDAPPEEATAKGMRVRLSRETAVIATLRNIISAQAQFQATARADEDQDGVGEYGSFGELSGAVAVRDGKVLNPPVLSTAFRKVEGGCVERGGYVYRIFLPQRGGLGIAERHGGGFAAGELEPDLAETVWCCYAWPKDGEGRTFFTNQMGDVLATAEGEYSQDREPHFSAAFTVDGVGITGQTALSGTACDRREWKQAG